MEDLTMFERLLTLPLFQGMSLNELSEALAHVRLDFVTYQAGDEVVCQGDPCRNLTYIINGQLNTRYRDDVGKFTLTEITPKIGLIEPDNLFGMYQKYSRDFIFNTDGVTLSIEKPVVINHLMKHNIIKINYLNIVCNKLQKTHRLLCNKQDVSIRDKIVRFVLSYSSVPKGMKEIEIKLRDLAAIINETRLSVSNELNKLQDQGLLKLRRGVISIPALEDLK